MSRPVHRLNAAAVWWMSIVSPFIASVAPAALASRSSCVSRGTYIRSSTSSSGGSSSPGWATPCPHPTAPTR